MKKIIKLLMCLLMCIAVVGCSGSSNDKQEAVVNNFFTYLKDGDLEKVKTLWVDGSEDLGDIEDIIEVYSIFDDVDLFGQTFVDEAKSFTNEVFKNYVVSYTIKEVKKDGDNYSVSVDGVMKDYESVDLESDEMTKYMENYQNEHLDEIVKYVQENGEEEAVKKIYTDVAPELFGMMKDEIKNAKEMNVKIVFTLQADGDNWLLSKMDVTKAS